MVVLIALSVAMAVTQWMLLCVDNVASAPAFQAWLALSAETVRQHHYWQFLSFGLLHANPVHLLGNMLILYFAGREVEPIIGRRHFLGLYLTGYVVGGLAQWLAMIDGWAPSGFSSAGGEVVLMGVSAAVGAVLAAYATILPELESTVHLFFLIPLRLRTKMVGVAGIGVALLLCIADSPGFGRAFGHRGEFMESFQNALASIGPVSILVGSIAGWVYVKCLGFGNPLWIQRVLYQRRRREARIERMPAKQFISEEIDPILDKISRQGMQSLTRTERKILEKGREKIGATVSAERRSREVAGGRAK